MLSGKKAIKITYGLAVMYKGIYTGVSAINTQLCLIYSDTEALNWIDSVRVSDDLHHR